MVAAPLIGNGVRQTTALSRDEPSPEADAPIGTANGRDNPSRGIVSKKIVEDLVANAALFASGGGNTVVAKGEALPRPPAWPSDLPRPPVPVAGFDEPDGRAAV